MVERQRAFHSDDYGYIGNLFLRGLIPEGLLWWDWVFYLQKHKFNVLLRVEGVLPFTLISFSSSTFCPLVVLQVFPWSSWTSSRSCCCCHLHYFLLLLTAGGVVLHLGVLTPCLLFQVISWSSFSPTWIPIYFRSFALSSLSLSLLLRAECRQSRLVRNSASWFCLNR